MRVHAQLRAVGTCFVLGLGACGPELGAVGDTEGAGGADATDESTSGDAPASTVDGLASDGGADDESTGAPVDEPPPECRVHGSNVPVRWQQIVDPDHFTWVDAVSALRGGGLVVAGEGHLLRYDDVGDVAALYESPHPLAGVGPGDDPSTFVAFADRGDSLWLGYFDEADVVEETERVAESSYAIGNSPFVRGGELTIVMVDYELDDPGPRRLLLLDEKLDIVATWTPEGGFIRGAFVDRDRVVYALGSTVGAPMYVSAIADGEVAWSSELPAVWDGAAFDPVVVGGDVLYLAVLDRIFGVDLDTGDLQWEHELETEHLVEAPCGVGLALTWAPEEDLTVHEFGADGKHGIARLAAPELPRTHEQGSISAFDIGPDGTLFILWRLPALDEDGEDLVMVTAY